VAAQHGFGMLKLAQAVSRAIYPELVRSGDEAHGLARRMTWWSGAVGLATVAATALLGQWALGMVAGPAYGFAYVAMVLLAAGAAFEMAAASGEALLIAQGRVSLALFIRMVPAGLALALLPFAIGQAGLAGAAACVLAGSLLAFAGFAGAGRKSREGLPASDCA
jgi:O-antigen/teichoic acid export membrane protein